MAPDAIVTSMDWLLKSSVGRGINGCTFNHQSFTDLDYANDVSVLDELLKLLIPVLEKAAPVSLQVNWQKPMMQALGSKNEPSSLLVCGNDVQCVEAFIYLGSLIHSSCSTLHNITDWACNNNLKLNLAKSGESLSTKGKKQTSLQPPQSQTSSAYKC